ncbi:hypothetical protein [Bradyrhizobium japonicum]|uniref:hypothetical protein n=1 Tax=Bradyrhizobium japonicum TaxID=375 RepID=UPI001BAB5108|nr:hypothetical protein [Bradyrhizobium japonicum]
MENAVHGVAEHIPGLIDIAIDIAEQQARPLHAGIGDDLVELVESLLGRAVRALVDLLEIAEIVVAAETDIVRRLRADNDRRVSTERRRRSKAERRQRQQGDRGKGKAMLANAQALSSQALHWIDLTR